MAQQNVEPKKQLKRERWRLLLYVQKLIELPMAILGIGWLVLLVIDLTHGLTPLLQTISNIIWYVFLVDFFLRFLVAPNKLKFLKANVLTVISLAVPALRALRILQIAKPLGALRGLRLLRVVSSLNRGLRSLAKTLHRRAFPYIMAATTAVVFAGSAGIYAFEKAEHPGIQSYWEALWFTAMLMTTIGSEFWPRSAEGRALSFILSLYGIGVFGYFTALLASFFIGRDAEDKTTEIAGSAQIEALRKEILALRKDLGKEPLER